MRLKKCADIYDEHASLCCFAVTDSALFLGSRGARSVWLSQSQHPVCLNSMKKDKEDARKLAFTLAALDAKDTFENKASVTACADV